MKKIILGLLIGVLVVLGGCLDDDGYSLSNMWVGFGVLKQTGPDPVEYQIVMDNDNLLIPVSSVWYHNSYYGDSQLGDGDRILVNYTIIGDNSDGIADASEYYVKINSIKKVLMKDIINITPENQDSIGNDPVIVRDVWVTDSLLNFKIKYWGYDQTHFINLVKQPGAITEASQPIELELRHNKNSDDESIPYSAYVSFKLNKLEIAGLDSIQFKVTATDYEGNDFEYEGVYHYGENN
ncbi:MAG TPA: NigD-like protein [Draconibacterium sp.]|nr:NigD-like protein [Draconibacterium sp.]